MTRSNENNEQSDTLLIIIIYPMFGTVVWTLTLFKLFYIFYGAMHIGFAEILCLNANDVMLNTKKQQTY